MDLYPYFGEKKKVYNVFILLNIYLFKSVVISLFHNLQILNFNVYICNIFLLSMISQPNI